MQTASAAGILVAALTIGWYLIAGPEELLGVPSHELCGGTQCSNHDLTLFRRLAADVQRDGFTLSDDDRRLQTLRDLFRAPVDGVHCSSCAGRATRLRRVHDSVVQNLQFDHQPELATAVMRRGAHHIELWREHQQHTGVWNEQLYNARPANQGCFPSTTTWWQTTKAVELLKKVHNELLSEYQQVTNQSQPSRLMEHPHGLQDRGLWFMSIFHLSGAGCTDRRFAAGCRAMAALVQLGLHVTEAKYLTMYPGTWVRPHTASTNQQLKIHFGISVPKGPTAVLMGCNVSHIWRNGTGFLFDDSFTHQVVWHGVEPKSLGEPRVVLDIKFAHPDINSRTLQVGELGLGTGLPLLLPNGSSHTMGNQLECFHDRTRDIDNAKGILEASLELSAERGAYEISDLEGEIEKESFYEDELFDALEDCQHQHPSDL